MRSRPILFSTEMMQALLTGRKTQTRRVVKPQPMLQGRSDDRVKIYQRGDSNLWEVKDNLSSDGFSSLNSFKCVYGKPGDVLWVRETWMQAIRDFEYKADHPNDAHRFLWKPSIHMPKAACRILLRITNVRVERLQDIGRQDALREGIQERVELEDTPHERTYYQYKFGGPTFLSAVEAFAGLWKFINGSDSWDANPWVWVVEFERIGKPEVNP